MVDRGPLTGIIKALKLNKTVYLRLRLINLFN